MLGNDGYGIWVLVLSFVGYYGLLDFGLHSATIRYVAISLGRKNKENLENVVNTSIFLYSGIGFLIIIFSLFFSDQFVNIFKIDIENRTNFKNLILVIGLAVGIGFPRRVLDAIFLGFEKFFIMNFLSSMVIILRAVVMLCVLYLNGGLIGLGIVELGMEIINFGLKIFFYRKSDFQIKISAIFFSKKTAYLLISFGFLTFLTLLGDLLRFNIDKAVLGSILGMESVAIYGVGFILVGLFVRLASAINLVTFPKLSKLAGMEPKFFEQFFFRSSYIVGTVVMGIALVVGVLARPFIFLWVGEDYNDSAKIAIILIGALAVDYSTSTAVNALKALNKQKVYAVQCIIEGIMNFSISVLLASRIGIFGVVYGTCFPLFLTKIFIQPVYVCKIIGVNFFSYLFHVVFKPGILAFFLYQIFPFVLNLENEFGYFNLFFNGAIISLTYFILCFWFCIKRKDRIYLKKNLLHLTRNFF